MKIHLVFMTYNRIEYTKRALPALLADSAEEFSLTIWDNGSSDGTVDYLKTIDDSRVAEIVFSGKNLGQAYVTNKIWSQTGAELVGKVDNDCLVTAGWTKILAKAHEDLPQLGVVGCWHFLPDDFDYNRAKHKVQIFGSHRIFRHPWVGGSALLVKRNVFMKYAPCGEREYLSNFWLRLAMAGYINGFYYPLIYQEHMDDAMHPLCIIKDQGSFQKYQNITTSLKSKRYTDTQGRLKWRQEILRNILDDPCDPAYYTAWRTKLRTVKSQMSRLLLKQ